MLATVGARAGAASFAVCGGTVDRAEGGGRQREEQPGPFPYVRRYGLAADESSPDQVEGVAGVEAGAGGAYSRAAVAAADQQPFTGFCGGVVVVQDFTGAGVTGGGRSGELDRVGAAARRTHLLQPPAEPGVLDEADQVLVDFGELTQTRRAVEHGASVSRGILGGDGGDLPGWAAVAARMVWVGWDSSMEITPGWSVMGQRMVPVPRQQRQRRRWPERVLR